MKKIILVLLLFLMLLSGCAGEKKEEEKKEEEPQEEALRVDDLATIHETEFGGVYLKMGIDEFNAAGFAYGDSVDVLFSNGYTIEDIPYYNGYYVDAGETLLIAYPGYDYIKAAINYGEDLWDEARLKVSQGSEGLWAKLALDEHTKASVVLREKGKYLDVQEASDIHYYDEIERYPDEVTFANFRTVEMGNISAGKVYRSASPCDDQHKRAAYVDDLIEEAGVNYILDLADSDVKIEKYIAGEDFSSDYFLSLYEKDLVCALALNMNYLSEDFAQKLAYGFTQMAEHDGPYLIHCTEGKDRTGFVCMLLEALAGAGYEAIKDDYMKTYDNYYQIREDNEPKKYETILNRNLEAMLKFLVNDEKTDPHACDLSSYARAYLIKAGMEEEAIGLLLEKIR
ncbi:MAG: tyrosine-protein phosphatase [Erysipelotrichaceae bacterium]|nr:tyrosine-protein phosphatase [Erysipelotrichaceae bacterium]